MPNMLAHKPHYFVIVKYDVELIIYLLPLSNSSTLNSLLSQARNGVRVLSSQTILLVSVLRFCLHKALFRHLKARRGKKRPHFFLVLGLSAFS